LGAGSEFCYPSTAKERKAQIETDKIGYNAIEAKQRTKVTKQI
jgi:hypothetical protein